eukprot:7378841-Prymnesium_polylepis.3
MAAAVGVVARDALLAAPAVRERTTQRMGVQVRDTDVGERTTHSLGSCRIGDDECPLEIRT